jgi:hypothetical protein
MTRLVPEEFTFFRGSILATNAVAGALTVFVVLRSQRRCDIATLGPEAALCLILLQL